MSERIFFRALAFLFVIGLLSVLLGVSVQAQGGYIRGGFLGNQFFCGHHGRTHTYPVYAEYGCYESGSGRGQQYNRNQIGGRSRRSSYSINITSSKVVGVAQVAESVTETVFGFKDNDRERDLDRDKMDHEYRMARLERGLPEGQGLVPVVSVSKTETKIGRNLFNKATVTIFVGSEAVQVLEPGAGADVRFSIPPGSQIWAEATLVHGGRLYRERLTIGNGIRPLPQNAGWEFYNPAEGGQ